MRGQIDAVKPEGIVKGWCWDEQSPDHRVEVSVLVDGVDSGTTLAGIYREDLYRAKIGDGFHHFSLVLSKYSIQKSKQTLILVHATTREPIGRPFIFYNKTALSFDDRLIELEAQNRLLETRLAEMAQSRSNPSHVELFSVVGNFFVKLAEDTERGLPLSLNLQLSSFLLEKVRDLPVLDFGHPTNPAFTIVINADCELFQLHTSLAALHRVGAGSVATINVLDPGRFDDVTLISSVVRNVTYIRAVADLVSEFTEIEINSGNEFILLLSGRALVADSLLKELQECATFFNQAGAIGACLTDDDGQVLHGGLYLNNGELNEQTEEVREVAHHAHALSHHAVAIRHVALRNVGGLNPMFGNDLASALIDLCFRLRRTAWTVLVQPFARLNLQESSTGESWLPTSLNERTRLGEFLRHTWFGQDFPLHAGCALVVGTEHSIATDLQVAQRLSDAAYSVTYLARDERIVEAKPLFHRAGATIALESAPEDRLLAQDAEIAYASEGTLPSFLTHRSMQVFTSLTELESFLAAQLRERGGVT